MRALLGCYVRFFPILFALVACGPQERCVTSCGLRADANDCDALEVAQSKALAAFNWWTQQATCNALSGLSLEIIPGDDYLFDDPFGRGRVGGLTWGDRITIASENWAKNGFSHELVHWFQLRFDGFTESTIDPATKTHPGWRGEITEAIARAQQ